MPRDRFAVPRESEAPRFLFYSLQSHDHVLRLAASAELVAQLSEAC